MLGVMTVYSELDRLGRSQHGLVTIGQLNGLGFAELQVRRMTASGRLLPVRRGIFRVCGGPPTWHSVALAAVLAAGEGAAISHRSAGVLWGLLDRHAESGALELIVPGQCRLSGVRAHEIRLAPGEVTRRAGIAVTSAERTLFDLAATEPADRLGRLCDEAVRRRIVTIGRLHAVVEAHRGSGRRRLVPIRAVLADRIDGYDPGANDWEQRMDRLWDRLGLPAAARQYRIGVGRRTFRVDRAIVDLRIAVEWAGFDPHGQRGHLDRDSDRRALLTAAGWCCLDFTSRSTPELIRRTVLAVTSERRRLLERPG
jgi:very-short-patch-repair endonuclease